MGSVSVDLFSVIPITWYDTNSPNTTLLPPLIIYAIYTDTIFLELLHVRVRTILSLQKIKYKKKI